MRKDVLDIILKQMSQDELIAAFMRVADLSQISDDDLKMEWTLGLYPSVSIEWIASHEEDIRKWVTDHTPNVRGIKINVASNPWYDVTVKVLVTEDLYVSEGIEKYGEIHDKVFEGITVDNALEKIDKFYSILREQGILCSRFGREEKKKVSVYALNTIMVDRDYINSLDKKAVPL